MICRLLTLAFFYVTSWTEASANPGGGLFEMMIPMALVFGIFYVLVIRPQQQKIKNHQEKISALKKGDEVVINGILGHIEKVDGDDFFVRLNPDVVVRCLKSAVTQVRDGSAKKTATMNDAKPKAAKVKSKPKASVVAKKNEE